MIDILDTKRYDALYEGLIKSYPIHSVIRFFKKTFINTWVSEIQDTGNYEIRFFNQPERSPDFIIRYLNTLEKTYGWGIINLTVNTEYAFIDLVKYTDIKNLKTKVIYDVEINIEPLHPIAIDTNKLPKKLFHLSPLKFKDNIIKKGLIPKSINKKFKHDDRVYFLDTTDSLLLSKLVKALSIYNGEHEWSLFEINTALLQSNFNLFNDVLMYNSYFTKDNIPPSAIKHIKDITV